MQKKNILVCEFYQESNTFNPEIMTLKQFEAIRFAEGKDLYEKGTQCPEAFHGMVDAIEENGGVVIPAVSMFAGAGGRIADEVLTVLYDRMRIYLSDKESFDAVFVSCHGAACTESEDDATGAFLEFLRKEIGREKIIAISCDLHANITQKILSTVDVICGYNLYPHTDVYETGYRAASIGMKKLNGEPVCMAVVPIPLLVPPVGYNTISGAFREVKDYGVSLVNNASIIDFSTFIVQPWLDIKEIGSAVIVIASDADVAKHYADDLSERVFSIRDEMWPHLYDLNEIVEITQRADVPKPVIVVDSADSPNAGAVGDSVEIAQRFLEQDSGIRMGFFVKDDDVVEQAFKVGVGNTAKFNIGAKYTYDMKCRFEAVGRVQSLHDGSFRTEGPENRSMLFRMGPVAVINFGAIDVMVCKTPVSTGDPQIFRHFGIEPTLYDLIVVKANTSFLVPYSAFAKSFYYADTYGASAANLKRFRWKNIPAGLYPFDLPTNFTLEKAKIASR